MGLGTTQKKLILIIFVFCLLFNFTLGATVIESYNYTDFTIDGYVRSSAPSGNYGASTFYYFNSGTSPYESYTQFDISELNDKDITEILDVDFQLYMHSNDIDAGETIYIDFYNVNSDYPESEFTITYNTRPSIENGYLVPDYFLRKTFNSASPENLYISFNITEAVQFCYDNNIDLCTLWSKSELWGGSPTVFDGYYGYTIDYTNDALKPRFNITYDNLTTQIAPIISNIDIPNAIDINVAYNGWIVENTAPILTLNTNEVATCKWSFIDEGYDIMDNYCAEGMDTTSHTCRLNNLDQDLNIVYFNCADRFGNYSITNIDKNIYVNTLHTEDLQITLGSSSQDSYISSYSTGTSYNFVNVNFEARTDQFAKLNSLIGIDVSQINLDNISEISQANISFKIWINDLESGETLTVNAHRVYSNYTYGETTTNWDNRPLPFTDFDPSILSTFVITSSTSLDFHEWDITSAIKKCKEEDNDMCVIYFNVTGSNTESGDKVYYKSTEESVTTDRPKFSLQYYPKRMIISGDTYTRSNNPTINYAIGNSITLVEGVNNFFGAVGINATQTVGELYNIIDLNYYVSIELLGSQILELYYCNDSFDEYDITYSNYDSEITNCDVSPFLTQNSTEQVAGMNSWDISSVYNNDEDGLFSIKLKTINTGYTEFTSKEEFGFSFIESPYISFSDPVTPSPTIVVNTLNNTAFNTSQVNISFTITDDDNTSVFCEIYVNGSLNDSVIAINNTETLFNLTLYDITDYTYFINCTDYKNIPTQTPDYNLSVWYFTCLEDWQPLYDSCNTDDTQLKYYFDNNICNTTNILPVDNGTFVACNFCSEDLEDFNTECQWNGSDFYRMTYYQDNNYFSCCGITDITSDCSVDDTNPYNITEYDKCNYYADDFEIEYDEQALYGLSFNEKVYWKFWINDTNMTEDYECISYVKHMNNGILGELIQVNPTYIKKTEGLISFDDSFDDREYFRTVNGLGNVYFTKDNLVFDVRQYLFGIQCTGNGVKLNSERVVTTEYEKLNTPITLSFWGQNNMEALFLGVIIFIFVTMCLGVLVYLFKRDSR